MCSRVCVSVFSVCVSVLSVWACQSVVCPRHYKKQLIYLNTLNIYKIHATQLEFSSHLRTVILVYLNLSTIFSVALKCNKHRALRPTPWDNPI